MRESGSILDGKYQILDRLGRGGMGEVYKVQHLHLHEPRVVKILRQDLANDPQLAQRFLQEARIATQIKHPNIAILHDISRLPDNSFYMVWEFVEGEDVGKMLRSGPLSPTLAAELGIQALRGLGAIHAAGVVHRDISPDNLMVGRDNAGRPQLKIIDLGLAKRLALPSQDDTDSGVLLGKLRYCAPEQASPDAPQIDARADLYSLGAVLYEMVAGKGPFDSESAHGFVLRKLSEPARPIMERNPDVRLPAAFDQTIRQALERDPANRFPDAAAFLQALVKVRDLLRGAVTVELPGTRPAPVPSAPVPPRRELSAEDKVEILARIEKASRRSDEGMRRLDQAQEAVDRGEVERAKELLEKAAEYVPQSQKLQELGRRVEELHARRELAERVSQTERLLEQYLNQRKIPQARLAFETLQEMWPDNPRRHDYAERLRSLETDTARQRELEQAVQVATDALLRADVSTARNTAKVLRESGEFERSRWLEAEIDRAQRVRDTQRGEVDRRDSFQRAVAAHRFEEAERELEGLQALGVTKVSLDSLRSAMDEERGVVRVAETIARGERQFAERVAARDWGGARDVVNGLADTVPDNPIVGQLLNELVRREEAMRKQTAIDQGVAQAEALIAQGNPADAELAVRILLKLDPQNPNRKRLEKQIEALWRV